MFKHGTMGNLKYLGLCWCFAFASFAALADFTSSDSQNLSDIEVLLESVRHNTYTQLDSIWGHVADISSDTDDVAYDLAIIKENVHSIRYQGLRNITNLLADINSKLVVSSVSSFTTNSYQTYDSLNVHDVRNDDIYSRLGDIQQSINNLTNYLCYSPEYVSSSSVITNLPFLFMPIDPYMSSTVRQQRIKDLFRAFYSRDPTQQEINRILSIVPNNNIRKYFTDGRIYLLDESALPVSYRNAAYNRIMYDWALNVPNVTEQENREVYSRAYNYLYGTRQLTDTSIGISNVVAQINQSFSNIFNSVQGEYSGARQLEESLQRPIVYDDEGKVKNDSGIVSAVVNLADDFCETIPGVNTNNIAEVNTNEIVNISDAGYQNKLNQISTDAITDNSTVLELQQAVDSINIQFVSFIPHVADTDELVLDFGTVSLFGVSKALVFTFQRLPALYWTIQRFLFAFLKALMVFLAIHAIYHHIAVESPL